MKIDALSRQKDIYLGGISGCKPLIPTDYHSLEKESKKRLSPKAYAYIAGGAGLESTLTNNLSAFNDFKIVPRMLAIKDKINVSTKFLNHSYSYPIFLSPIGVLQLAHPKGDLEVAAACRETGVPMAVSNQASYPMEKISEVLNGSPWFFQLYISKIDELSISFVKRAEQAGARGIFITLDTTLLGWRNRDLNLAYLPFLQGKGIAQYTSDPIFQKIASEWPRENSTTKINFRAVHHLISLARNHPGKFIKNIKGAALNSVRAFTQLYTRPDLDWSLIEKIKNNTALPVVLKGIQSIEDAQKCKNHGFDGMYISNHGGRQVDGAIGSLHALNKIISSDNTPYPTLFDSGIRSGADIMKAMSLGAHMVGIGRPYTYALALAGAKGVIELIKNMISELELNMGLSGVNRASDLNKKVL